MSKGDPENYDAVRLRQGLSQVLHTASASPISLPLGKVGPFQPLVPRHLELPLGFFEAVDVATVHFDLVRIERCSDTKCP
jgi:hypothetical protein